jgi:MYXO-CTERM domain-containing protein
VSDADHVAREPNARLYLDDSVQVAFDPAATGGRGYDDDDEEWGCIAREGGTARFAGDGAGVVCVTTREGPTTSYEVAIPRASIPESTFANGARLRFSMLVNEDDGATTRDGTGREGWLELTRSIGAFKEPESFAEIVFSDRTAAMDVDAGRPADPDASVPDGVDGGPRPTPAEPGCACRVTRARTPRGLELLLALSALVALRRRWPGARPPAKG